MKRIILLLLFISSILRANYLITNGEIALFYDGKNNILTDVKAREFSRDVLSNLQILLIKDYKIYKARNYYAQTKFIDGKNIFYMKYNINDNIIETYIILSNKNKNNMFIYTNLNGVKWDKPYKLVYKFSPLILEGNVENKDGYYRYDMLNFSKDNNSDVLIATERDFESFKVKLLETTLLKGLNERIYLVKDIKEKKEDSLEIVFSRKKPRFSNVSFGEIMAREKKFWDNFNKKYYYLRETVINQIKNFYLMSLSNQNNLNMNMSRVKYIEQLKVIYLNGILNKERLIPEFNFDREDNIQNMFTYYYYIKLSDLKGNKDIKKIVKNNFFKVKNDIQESYKSIINKEGDWLENSHIFYNFLLEIEKLEKNELLLNEIKLMKEDIRGRVKNEILNSSGIVKNNEYIKYLDILSQENQIKNIKKLLENTKNLVRLLKKDDIIDSKANLSLSLLLYKNNYIVESDKIFYNIDYFINSNERYNKLDLEEIYLYLLNIQYRGLI